MPLSLQQSAPGSKSAKFVQQNPLDPLLSLYDGADQEELSQRLHNRLAAAAPRQVQTTQTTQNPATIDATSRKITKSAPTVETPKTEADEDSEDDDSDFEDDDDDIIQAIRRKRLAEMKKEYERKSKNGEYRIISQDVFLQECNTTDSHVVVLFFHTQFARCHYMTKQLQAVAQRHAETKFVGVDVEKTPFFVEKLKVRTLPTLLVFTNGTVVQRKTGFEGLSNNPAAPDEWDASDLEQWLGSIDAIEYTEPIVKEEEEEEKQTAIRRGLASYALDDDDEYDE